MTHSMKLALLALWLTASTSADEPDDAAVAAAVAKGLRHLALVQGNDGRWEADGGQYRVAITALAGMALLMDGNTPTQGLYAPQVQLAIDYILSQAQPSGLLGHPERDDRYLYGHGFAMLFLSQVVGEEADKRQRDELIHRLTAAVAFSARAQTNDGGWGYVSARDGQGFDEGSVTITQMQGLRGCRNAGIPVPRETIAKGVKYIERCTNADGGVRYSLRNTGGARPPITAAALAGLFEAGQHNHPLAEKLADAANRGLDDSAAAQFLGHWHYAHYYYSQVMYRRGGAAWSAYRAKVYRQLLDEQTGDGSWRQGYVGSVYATALNLAILQLDKAALPIYQR